MVGEAGFHTRPLTRASAGGEAGKPGTDHPSPATTVSDGRRLLRLHGKPGVFCSQTRSLAVSARSSRSFAPTPIPAHRLSIAVHFYTVETASLLRPREPLSATGWKLSFSASSPVSAFTELKSQGLAPGNIGSWLVPASLRTTKTVPIPTTRLLCFLIIRVLAGGALLIPSGAFPLCSQLS